MSSIIQNKFHSIIGDAARTTKFNFILPPVAGSTALTDIITYSVKSLTLPKIEHNPINIMHKGRPIPIRGTTKFSQTFTVTFYMHENHIVKNFFETWIAMIEQRHYYYDPRKQSARQRQLSQGGAGLPPYMTWYNVTAFIEQRNFDGDRPTAIYEISNVFPISVDPPSYDYSSVGTIAEVSVTFAFSHYTMLSKPMHSGALLNQLNYTTEFNGSTDREQHQEYSYELDRFKLFNQFDNLDQTSAKRQEIYWRPYELARWDNLWNRWRENKGENTKPGTPARHFDPDNI